MIRAYLLPLVFSAAFALQAVGQEVRTVNGTKYIAHTVSPGETLFGLSRHYAVPLDALNAANPGATTSR